MSLYIPPFLQSRRLDRRSCSAEANTLLPRAFCLGHRAISSQPAYLGACGMATEDRVEDVI